MHYESIFFLFLLRYVTFIIGYGVVYDPIKYLHQPLTIREDLRQISRHFDAVRIYSPICGHVNLGPYIRDAGLKVTMGINLQQPLEPQLHAAFTNAADQKNYVHAIIVGNEDVRRYGVDRTIGVIRRVKHELAKRGKGHILVGTAQTTTDLLSRSLPGIKELGNECTAIAANIYPYFSRHKDPIETLTLQYRWLQQRFPKARVMITETGWPSGGEWTNAFGNHASMDHAREYFRRFNRDWFKPGMPGFKRPLDMYYFQYFDTPYRHQIGGPLREQHFGIVSAHRHMKFPHLMPKRHFPNGHHQVTHHHHQQSHGHTHHHRPRPSHHQQHHHHHHHQKQSHGHTHHYHRPRPSHHQQHHHHHHHQKQSHGHTHHHHRPHHHHRRHHH